MLPDGGVLDQLRPAQDKRRGKPVGSGAIVAGRMGISALTLSRRDEVAGPPECRIHRVSLNVGHFPWDDMLRLSPQRLTPAAQEMTSLAGLQESFGKAAERTLRKLAGLRLLILLHSRPAGPARA
jgi:hypothetical protein